MITDKQLSDLGLPSYENGYYWINDNLTVDCEGYIRFETDRSNTRHYIAHCYTMDEVKEFIKIATR